MKSTPNPTRFLRASKRPSRPTSKLSQMSENGTSTGTDSEVRDGDVALDPGCSHR